MECYLGLQTMVGRSKKEAFCDRMSVKVNSWSNCYLSQGRKEVYVKTVLQALPIFSLSCFLFPKTLCYELESIM